MPGLDILFIRLAWSYFEPSEGNYDWHYIDDLVNEYAGKGLRFGFAFTCKETDTNGTPAPVGYALELRRVRLGRACSSLKLGCPCADCF